LLLLLAILFVVLRSHYVATPVAVVPAVEATRTVLPTVLATVPPTAAPTALRTAAPTSPPPTALPVAQPRLNLPAAADYTVEGVKLGGTGEPGATVELWDGTTKLGTAVVGADGIWSLVSKLGEGAHKLVVRTVDAAGNILNESAALDVAVPATVALPELNLPAADDYAAEGVRLGGTGEPGATVEVWDGATKVGTAVVGADGVWSLVSRLDEGAHTLAVRTVDAAGNILNEAPGVEIMVPAVMVLPQLNAPAAADYTAEGIRLSGTGQPGATVEVWDGATKVGTAVVGADGIWSLVGTLGGGAHWLAVRTLDAAGSIVNEPPPVEVTVAEGWAPVASEDLTAWGEAYTVRWGDWLQKLARRFYGDSSLYTRIVDGTNAKAMVDSTFTRITNPNRIRVGQKLWIPAMPGGK
jgi:2-polyprenyl-6-methoxyphenol hydroxylase-like FAD-dependent oxidoreductase